MTGTFVNCGAIAVGTAVGLGVGQRMPERFKNILMQALGLSVLLVGLQMSLPTQMPLVAIGCLIAGAVTGEALRIEHWVTELGSWLKMGSRSWSWRKRSRSACQTSVGRVSVSLV